MLTKNSVISSVTRDYLSQLISKALPDPEQIEAEVLDRINKRFKEENLEKDRGEKWRLLQELPNSVIADIVLGLYRIVRLARADDAGNGYHELAIYQREGPDEGIYTSEGNALNLIIRSFNYGITSHSIQEVIDILKGRAPICSVNANPDLIAVNNGIFHYRTKMLMPFTPDIVFTSKSKVDYDLNAQNPVIHNSEDGTDWDVESWMRSLSDNPRIVNLLWQTVGASIRPYGSWNKAVCLYSERGNNGKGTLCRLIQNLCGAGNYASIPFSAFGQEFMLDPLLRASVIIVDENETQSFTKSAAALKAVITGDCVMINQKYKDPSMIRFKGLMVQCINALPRVSDKSESFYRRFLFIPFEKCFQGRERGYIKDDYLNRPEVLRYVLKKVLNMDYYALDNPQECQDLLKEYKEFNDPVRQFLEEILPKCVWELVPYGFLYDLYREWHKRNCPSGQPVGKVSFTKDVKGILADSREWIAKENPIPTRDHMAASEPLILEYNLRQWMSPIYRGNDEGKICQPLTALSYVGLLRQTMPGIGAAQEEEADEELRV